MKKLTLLLLGLFLLIDQSTTAQSLRYFQFSVNCGHGNWEDSSFVAATSDPAIIDSVLANLARPFEERQLISGPIAAGNAGYNKNASYWFKWHFVPNEWQLADFAMEVCDGCPFSDIDADTAYWLGTVGSFCPWSSKPVREIEQPTSINDPRTVIQPLDWNIYPNPANNSIRIKLIDKRLNNSQLVIYNILGEQQLSVLLDQNADDQELNIAHLPAGLYLVKIQDKTGATASKKLVIAE